MGNLIRSGEGAGRGILPEPARKLARGGRPAVAPAGAGVARTYTKGEGAIPILRLREGAARLKWPETKIRARRRTAGPQTAEYAVPMSEVATEPHPTRTRSIRQALVFLALAAGAFVPATAEEAPRLDAAPRGAVVLTVEGHIAVHNSGRAEVLDMAMLRALPHRSFTTTTVWTAGPQRFEGVLLRDLVKRLGVTGNAVIVAHAVNDYEARIPLSDATDPGPIVAYSRNGEPMTLREKGPLWLVYPYDQSAKWQTEVVYSRSIWQLDHMTIVPGAARR